MSLLDRTQQELIRGYLVKAREKVGVARELFSKGYWDDKGEGKELPMLNPEAPDYGAGSVVASRNSCAA